MNKDLITLYSREGWAVSFKNKEEFLKIYSLRIIRENIGKQYDQLLVEKNYSYDFENDKRILVGESRMVIKYDYILRDHNGDPLTVGDFPYIYKRKRKNAVVNFEKGDPVPKTGKVGKRNKLGSRGRHNKTGKGFLQYCSYKEEETENGVSIPPIRKKVVKELKERKVWQYYEGMPYYEENKNWKKYRNKQWK